MNLLTFPLGHLRFARVLLVVAMLAIGIKNGSAAEAYAEEKSQLVRGLETIFNDDLFASVPVKISPRSCLRCKG